MSEALGGITDFLGSAVGEGAAFAAGYAVGPVLAPILQALRNETWSSYPDAPLDAMVMAQAVAEGKIDLPTGASEAALTGISVKRFGSLVTALENSVSIAAGMTLIRRGQLNQSEFATVLKRAGLEQEWVTAYQTASTNGLAPWQEPLSVPDIALGMVRNNLRATDSSGNPIFPAGLDSTKSTIPQHPIPNIDVQAEAAMSGLTLDRFTVIANNVGLPPGVVEGLQMLRRGIITDADFALLVEQSDMRIAWGPAVIKLAAAIFTAHEAADLRLRGYIDTPTMYQLGAMEGYSTAQMDLMLDDIGRPLPVHQITTGLERGGAYDGTPQTVPSPYQEALEQSNIKPPWYSLAYANRYTYPGYFVLKPLVASGALTVTQATTYLLYEGWEPNLAALTAESFAPAPAASTNTHVKSAATSLITAARKAFLNGVSEPDTRTALTAAGVDQPAQDELIQLWTANKALEAIVVPPTA